MTKGRIMLAGVVGLAAVGALTTPARAQQEQRQRGRDLEQRMEMLKQELELTEDQVTAVETIFAEQDERRRELFEGRSEDRRAMREQMGAFQGEMDKELAEVLTAEQMKKLQELREQRRQQFRQGGGRRGPPPTEG